MHCQGTASSSTQGLGYLIVYGVKGSQSNVHSDVYDMAYVVDNGKMSMKTNLDINGYEISKFKAMDNTDFNFKYVENCSGVNMANGRINHLALPNTNGSAVNKIYVDSNFVTKQNGQFQSNVDMNNNKIINLKNPTTSQDAVTQKYADNNFVSRNSRSDINMNNHKIVNLGYPSQDNLMQSIVNIYQILMQIL